MSEFSKLKPSPTGEPVDVKDAVARQQLRSTQTVSGNPLTLTDCAPINAESLVVELEPKQDLHGQDAPYVGGSGKNLVDYAAFSESSIVSVALDKVYDDAGNCIGIKFNGTSTSDAYLRLNADVSGLPEVQGKLNFSIDGTSFPGEVGVDTTDSTYPSAATAPNTDITITDLSKVIRLWVYMYTGRTFDNVILKPMIRLATETDTTFAPYSNICPITGYNECEVDDIGANVWDEEWATGYWDEHSGNFVSYTGFVASKTLIPVQTGTTYHTRTPNIEFDTCRYDANGSFLRFSTVQGNDSIVTASDECFITFNSRYVGEMTTYNHNDIIISAASTSASIQFGQTVYGGKVDFKTGVVTVDRALEVFDGSDDEGWSGTNSNKSRGTSKLQSVIKRASSDGVAVDFIKSNMFKKGTASEGWAGAPGVIGVGENGALYTSTGAVMSISDWTTYLVNNNLQICYELATPFTIQLTPDELKLLKGTNNITTNGTTINLGYQPDNVIGEVKGEIQKITEMPYLRILDNDVDTEVKDYRLYYRLISSSYTLVNLAEMLQHRFLFVEVIQNPSGTANHTLLHSALIDPRTIDGFEYQMKAGTGDTVIIESNIAENKFDLSVRYTGAHTSGDPTDYYVTIRFVD